MHADTLDKAEQMLERHRPNSILLDWPDLGEATKHLRGTKGRILTPVVATVKDEPRLGRFFWPNDHALNNVRFLQKPYSELQLLNLISSVTRRAV
jgi:hypothetical protein